MILSKLEKIWKGVNEPFFKGCNGDQLFFNQLQKIIIDGIENVRNGDVVALIGDFEPESIATLLTLLDKGAIVVPLTKETMEQHKYFIDQSHAQHVFERNKFKYTISVSNKPNILLNQIREKGHPGLILFTTGTTGRPKAILHDFTQFISRYKTPRPPLRALSFLLFDHIGGLNTLFHMLFNQGQVISLQERTVESVINAFSLHAIELLPATPTFLRMMSLYSGIEDKIPECLKIISYGTERMDQVTLDRLCNQFPNIDFRQTYGMSELGILRIKSKARNSLYMNVGGEGVETKIKDNILYIKSKNRMMGYLNAADPFSKEGWYCTKDIVELGDDGSLKIIGRDSDIINVGGLKFLPSEVELICLKSPFIRHAKAIGKNNPITGQHVALIVELNEDIDKKKAKIDLLKNLKSALPRHMIPLSIEFKKLKISHRFKKT